MRFTLARWLLAGFAAITLAGFAACGGGDDNSTTVTPTATATYASTSGSPTAPASSSPGAADSEPLKVVRATLDAINGNDIDAAYANLSADARKEISLNDARRVINGLATAGVKFSINIDGVGEQTINENAAEINLTLSVHIGETAIPVHDDASLVKEGGQWKVSDHFLQTALAAVGLGKPLGPSVRELGPDGCAIGDPLEGVYAPARLQVLDPCITVTGTVRADITNAEDGDITFGLYVTGEDLRLINDVNRTNYDSALHIEIVPEDQQRLKTPTPGQKVKITGPWVNDLVHGHNEIHPAFKIEPAD